MLGFQCFEMGGKILVERRPQTSGNPKLNLRALLGLATGAAASAAAPSIGQAAPAAVQPPSIVMLDAMTLADVIRARKVSCVEVMTAYLDNIEKLNPRVNAIVAKQDRATYLATTEVLDRQ